jgi:acyl-CoA synthetase (AMP-forming)/AMP-acid ligase II
VRFAKNISELIYLSAKKFSDEVFIRFLDNKNKISFFELEIFKNRFHNYLNDLKIKQNQKIAVLFDNSPLLILFYLLIPGSFRVFVPLNPNSGNKEIEYILTLTKPALLIFDEKLSFKIKNIKIKKIKIKEHNFFINKLQKVKIKNKIKFNKKNMIAQVLFTSGSTGNPKGVPTSHENIICNLKGIINRLIFPGKNKNFLSCTPLFHNSGQTVPTLTPLALGGTTCTIPPLQGLGNFVEICNKYKINYTLLMPTHINYLNSLNKKKKFKNMDFICVGGAKLEKKNQKDFENKFNTKIYADYGLTETSSIAASEGPSCYKYGSVGRPLYNNKILVKKFNNKKYGEILIKGKNVFNEYYKNKNETKNKLINNFLHTGDIGWFDNDGFLFIKDRADSMINVSGENVYPSEIERYTNNFFNIKLSVLLGIKDPITDNKLCLIYESKNGKIISSIEIISYLSKKIAKFKIPKYFFEVKEIGLNEIPKAPNRKILRKKLKVHFDFFIKNSKNFL